MVYTKLAIPKIITSPRQWLHDVIQNPRRIIVSGALRSGKDATTALCLDTIHKLDPSVKMFMFSPPLDDLPKWIDTTMNLNDPMIWEQKGKKLLWINEALLAINPQDWANKDSKTFARKIPISSHKNLRLFVSSQSGEALKVLIDTASARIFKRMDFELMDSLFRSKIYLREFFMLTESIYGQGVFQHLEQWEAFLDVGNRLPIELPSKRVPDWFTDKVSKNWEHVSDSEIKEITGLDKKALDYDDLKSQEMNKLDYMALMSLHVYAINNPKKQPEDVSLDNFMANLTIAGLIYNMQEIDQKMRVMSKEEARNTLPRIKLLHNLGMCPYCDEDSQIEIKNRLNQMRKGKLFKKKPTIKAFL
ncbi:MAG: hypothetical protein HeimC2_32230 [Candidatus Heimdallarchaeota archaeon LC_2]|nr:MAG: hypothetical protein HeimC2_32230 [Candidatus Heimdallarchaeota archaeon LC_2]